MSHHWLVYRGQKATIEFAELSGGTMPALEFINGLPQPRQAKLQGLILLVGDQYPLKNEQKFKNIGNGFYEFKSFQDRLIAFFHVGYRLVLTHGFVKKKDNIDPSELERARRIRTTCLNIRQGEKR